MSRARDNADLGDSYGSLAVGVTGGSGLNALSASNLSAGTVADARMPNLTGDITTVEGAVATTIANDAVSLAKMAGGTDGNLITYDTSGDPAYVATGTSGHVLTSAGANAVPAFAAAAAGGVEAGTKMIFVQTAAPTGWTKVTSGDVHDRALRLTTGTIGTGGSVAFETAFADQTVPVHTLTVGQIPQHNHYIPADGGGSGPYGVVTGQSTAASYSTGHQTQSETIGGISMGNAHGHGAIDLNVNYVDAILATKD